MLSFPVFSWSTNGSPHMRPRSEETFAAMRHGMSSRCAPPLAAGPFVAGAVVFRPDEQQPTLVQRGDQLMIVARIGRRRPDDVEREYFRGTRGDREQQQRQRRHELPARRISFVERRSMVPFALHPILAWLTEPVSIGNRRVLHRPACQTVHPRSPRPF